MEQIGPYRIEHEIARGGMGVVYRARGPDDQPVALKLMLDHRSADPRALKRFRVEIEALSRLRHPNLVEVRGVGEHEGAPWLALEFIEGETLQTRLRRGPLPVDEAIQVAHQLAQALARVHACGVLHRDLTPANVLLRGDQALLTDFGLALDEDASVSRITASGMFLGTPGYWSPEQLRGERELHGPHTDVYGLGGVLYACLTGHAPVRAETLHEYFLTWQQQEVRSPREERPDVPRWLSELCMRCLAVDRQDRPTSMDELSRGLLLREAQDASPAAGPSRAVTVGLVCAAAATAVATGMLWSSRATPPPPTPPLTASAASLADSPPANTASPADAPTQVALDKLRAGLPQDALAAANRALELDPAHVPALLARTHALSQLARHEEALAPLAHAIEFAPNEATTHALRGRILATLDRLDEALPALDRALELAPNEATTHANRGKVHAKRGNYEKALADYTRALEIDPDQADSWGNRGVVWSLLGNHEAAVDDYTRSLELEPRDAQTLANRGRAFATLGKHSDALADYDRSLEQTPTARTYVDRGRSLCKLGRAQEGFADRSAALALDPNFAAAYGLGGRILISQREPQLALADLRRAVELGSTDAAVHANCGLAFAILGRFQEALPHFARAIELDPENAMCFKNRGTAHLRLEHLEEAVADYERALELGLSPTEDAAVRRLRDDALERLGR